MYEKIQIPIQNFTEVFPIQHKYICYLYFNQKRKIKNNPI